METVNNSDLDENIYANIEAEFERQYAGSTELDDFEPEDLKELHPEVTGVWIIHDEETDELTIHFEIGEHDSHTITYDLKGEIEP